MGWEIVRARTLAVGDVVRPINRSGPLVRVTEIVREGRRLLFRWEPFADSARGVDLPVADVADFDNPQRCYGHIPRMRP